jgi:hypothetical protein
MQLQLLKKHCKIDNNKLKSVFLSNTCNTNNIMKQLIELLFRTMKKYVVQYWYRDKYFEKDFDYKEIISDSEENAMRLFRETTKRYFSEKIISTQELNTIPNG